MTNLEVLEAGLADGSIKYHEAEMDAGAKMGAAIEFKHGGKLTRLGLTAPKALFDTERAKRDLAAFMSAKGFIHAD